MNLTQILTFLEVAKQNSFRKASETLLLTQPAVSAQIRALEEELGAPLFLRQRVRLSSAGKAFLPYARQVAALLEEGKQAVQETENLQRGSFTIGAHSGAAITILPRLLTYFRDVRPSLQVTVHTLPGDQVIQGVLEGRLDAGICYQLHPTDLLEYQVLFYDNLTLVAPPDHPAAQEPYFQLERLKETPLISLVPEAIVRKLIDQVLRENNIQPEFSIELSSLEEVKRMVREGLGLALIPQLCIDPKTDGNLRQLRVPGLKSQIPGVLVYPKERHHSSALRRLLDDIRGIYTPEEGWS
ncbi:MAG: LysR family transcriptional regulator [Firmicutes bacterium]|uniref:DNA-binding transcriptional regulator, LysR family n=1 Tax=Melghirimyces thermohalophilus TaxID=1236220 RepID=A0A1G6RMZ6_9BACL|nr:LysR family transcriptional regulator [Melghirimyces thermohalophilus]MDA8353292.1 LysR family transcriptional regulator [Bacillota bacterium]SDD05928.1 DNA-binding transcriptional regulator, LysR family [Melghirimyces thermohalophilus]